MGIVAVRLKKPQFLDPPRESGDDARDLKQLRDYVREVVRAVDSITIEVETDDETA